MAVTQAIWHIWVNTSSVCFASCESMGAAILELATTYLPRWVAPLAATGAAIDAFGLTMVPPLAATSGSSNPAKASLSLVTSYFLRLRNSSTALFLCPKKLHGQAVFSPWLKPCPSLEKVYIILNIMCLGPKMSLPTRQVDDNCHRSLSHPIAALKFM